MRFRLLPFLMFACFLLFLVKAADHMKGTSDFSENLLVGSGYAESKEKSAEDHPKKEGEEGAAKGEEGAKKEEKPAEKETIKVSETPPEHVVPATLDQGPQFSAAEIEVLQRLRQRREQLEQRAAELEMREKVLRVTEGNIDQKITGLNKLKSDVEAILAVYNQKEEMKLMSLVKIYENMKPKDAARIFEELDMQTLLPVIDKMKETKVAPVLAKMDPKKAKAVTTELSQMRKLPTAKADLQN